MRIAKNFADISFNVYRFSIIQPAFNFHSCFHVVWEKKRHERERKFSESKWVSCGNIQLGWMKEKIFAIRLSQKSFFVLNLLSGGSNLSVWERILINFNKTQKTDNVQKFLFTVYAFKLSLKSDNEEMRDVILITAVNTKQFYLKRNVFFFGDFIHINWRCEFVSNLNLLGIDRKKGEWWYLILFF